MRLLPLRFRNSGRKGVSEGRGGEVAGGGEESGGEDPQRTKRGREKGKEKRKKHKEEIYPRGSTAKGLNAGGAEEDREVVVTIWARMSANVSTVVV